MYMVIPGVAIFITVLAFNLFGDGVRDALDPKGFPTDYPCRPGGSPMAPASSSTGRESRRMRVSTHRHHKTAQAAAAAAVVVAALLTTAACGGGGDDDDSGSKRRGRLQRGHQQGRPGLPRQEGRHAEVRGAQDVDSWDTTRGYYGFAWDFMRYYSRTLVTDKAEPGAKGAEVTPDLATSHGEDLRRRQDLHVQAA